MNQSLKRVILLSFIYGLLLILPAITILYSSARRHHTI